MFKGNAFGQAFSEYGLIAALVVVASISALAMLGNTLNQKMGGILSAPPPSVQIAANPAVPSAGVGNALNSGVSIKLASGTILYLDPYPRDVSKSVQTAGVNGATDILADSIASIAHQLVQKGDITPAQEGQLIALANQAHTIADIEKMVEDALKKKPDKATLMTTPVTFNNTTYTHIGHLTNEIGILTDTQTAGGQLNSFNALLAQINSSGALADPALNQLVNGLAANVQNLADQTENTFWDVTNNGVSPSAFLSTVASKTTNEDAAGICKAGQGTDSGVSCS